MKLKKIGVNSLAMVNAIKQTTQLKIEKYHNSNYAFNHHSKYWMPIHYDTIEEGQNKTKQNKSSSII